MAKRKNNEVVGIYCRLSDEDRYKTSKHDDSQSIQNQKSMLIEYALKMGWNIYKIYSDDDYSGADRNRPAWNELLKDCEEKRVNIVLCKSLSRFTRELEITESIIHGKFAEWGIRFVSLVDNSDTDIESNRKQRQINALTNEWYLEDVSNNVKRTLRHLSKNGKFIGSFSPYGYIKDPNDKHHLVVDIEAAAVVKRIFKMFTSGIGTAAICRILNCEKISSPAVYKKKEQGLKFYCAQLDLPEERQIWTPSTISRMLDNEMYIGNMVLGRHKMVSYKVHKKVPVPQDDWIIVKGTHEPIVDMETWNLVREIKSTKKRTRTATGTISSPLIFKIFCGCCGASMHQKNVKQHNGTKVKYLRCPTRMVSDNCTNYSATRLQNVEALVIEEINKLIDSYYDEQKIEFKPVRKSRVKEIERKIESHEKEIVKFKDETFELYQDKMNGVITTAQFLEFSDKLMEKQNRLKDIIKILNDELKKEKEKESHQIDVSKLMSKYRHIDKLTMTIVNEFIDKILIDKIDGETTCDIYWNF